MLEHLFGSKTRVRLLKHFFQHPDTPYYVRELARHIRSQMNAVRRELMNLEHAGIVHVVAVPDEVAVERGGNLARCTWYQLAQEGVYHEELRSLMNKSRMVGEKTMTQEIVKALGLLELLLLTGHFTDAHDAPTDMLIVGDALDAKKLARIVHRYEEDLGRSIRYTVFSSREFRERQQIVDKFLFSIFQSPHVVVVG